MTGEEVRRESPQSAKAAGATIGFAAMFSGAAGMGVIAVGASVLLDTPLIPQLRFSAAGAIAGLLAVAPMALALYWLMTTKIAPVARFREDQLDFFSGLGFRLTPLRIAALSLAAGVSEELLFRGVAQTWTAERFSLGAALIAPNIIFGLLHARSLSYALIAGFVGVYLGALFALTGDLLAPIIAHAVYDVIALDATRRALAARGHMLYAGPIGREVG